MEDKVSGYEIMEWRFKAIFNQLMDGKTLHANSEEEVKKDAEKFASEYPGDEYYSRPEAIKATKDYLENKLAYVDCPIPLKEAIVGYEFRQLLSMIF